MKAIKLFFVFAALLSFSTFVFALENHDEKGAKPPKHASSYSQTEAASFEEIVDNGDGTFTFRQRVDENSTPPHYDASASVGGFEIYSWYDEDYGWMHRFDQWNADGLNILSAKLTIRAWDVDSEPEHGYDGEYDGVYVDGTLLSPGYLQGETDVWSETVFDLPVNSITDDGDINVWLDIDMHHETDTWATTLDYSIIEIKYAFIANDPPYQPDLALFPSDECAGNEDDLIVNVVGPSPADPDGDAVSYEYRWFVDVGTGGFIDDEFAGRGNHVGFTVPAEDTQVDDIWQVQVIPVDSHGAIGEYAVITFPQVTSGSCFRSLFDSDVNVGLSPVVTHFWPMVQLEEYHWWLDLDVRSDWDKPCYAYWEVKPPTGKDEYTIRLNNFNFNDFITVYPGGGLGHLQVVASSPALKEFTWDNAIDGDTYWYSGTALVTDDSLGVWAIFEFTDQGTRKINKFRLMNDTGIGQLPLQVTKIQVLTSTTDMDDASFSVLLDGKKNNNMDTPLIMNDDWMEWDVSPTEAKYIKLIVEEPSNKKWRQLGEFQAWYETTLADADSSVISVVGTPQPDGVDQAQVTLIVRDSDGNPLSNLTAHDIKLFSKQKFGKMNTDNECANTETFGELINGGQGIYQTTLTSTKPGQKIIVASVNGVIIDNMAEVNFGKVIEHDGTPCVQGNELVFVEGTETYSKGKDVRNWDNAIDGDMEDWDGTTLTRGTGDPASPAWAIFKFCDEDVYMFNHVLIVTDNGVADDDDSELQVTSFEIWVSTTTMDPDAFSLAMKFNRVGDGTERWYKSNDDIFAKYVKLKLLQPSWTKGGWRELVEIHLDTELKQGPEKASAPGFAGEFSLRQAYPNPFNPVTSISYSIPKDAKVTLKIYDITGKEITTLVNGFRSRGKYSVEWNASAQASGVYFYKITAGKFTEVKRMILLK